MTDKSDVVGRLRARADEQERNNSYPVDRALDREAADEIDRLTAALASERERADAKGVYSGMIPNTTIQIWRPTSASALIAPATAAARLERRGPNQGAATTGSPGNEGPPMTDHDEALLWLHPDELEERNREED